MHSQPKLTAVLHVGDARRLRVSATSLATSEDWRARFRGQFIAYFRREAPELEVVAEREYEIDFRGPAGAEGTLRLDRLFAQGTEVPVGDTAAKEALFAHFVKAVREGKNLDALDADRDRQRVLSRLVTDDSLRRLRADGTSRTGKTLSALPSGVAGLSIVFVLDSESSVAYLTDDLLAELELSPGEALELAKENLRRAHSPRPGEPRGRGGDRGRHPRSRHAHAHLAAGGR